MALSPVAPTAKEPVQAVSLVRPEADAREELQTEVAKPAEVMLFEQRAEYAIQAPKMTATYKPAYETAGAAVVSTHTPTSLFPINSEGRLVASAGVSQAAGGVTALPSALSSPEGNSKGSDKKDEGNTYVAAHKKLSDIRMEALDDDIMSIMALC